MQVQSVLYEQIQHRRFQPGYREPRTFRRNDRSSCIEQGASVLQIGGRGMKQRRCPAGLALLAAAIGVRSGGQEELNDLYVIRMCCSGVEGSAEHSIVVGVGTGGEEASDLRYIAFLCSFFEGMALVAVVAVGDVPAAAAGEEGQKRE
jgi:hypothetical protein